MREYEFVTTEESIEVLRRLREPWAGYETDRSALRVRLADGTTVRIDVDGADLERQFEVFRIEATVERAPVEITPQPNPFGAGPNDIVLFRGESWIEAPERAEPEFRSDDTVIQFSGRPGQHTESAAALCVTSDAVLIASPRGTGVLVRTGAVPYRVEITEDRLEIARFLGQRGYASFEEE
jgi:hypothetical protein